MKKQEIDDVFHEHKEIYLFFADLRPNSVTMILRASKVTVKIGNLTKKLQFLGKFIFFTQTQPEFNSTSNLDTERVSSCYGCRYRAANLVDLLSFLPNIIDSSKNCRNYTINLDTKYISSYNCCSYQAINLVVLLSHSSNDNDSIRSLSLFINLKRKIKY